MENQLNEIIKSVFKKLKINTDQNGKYIRISDRPDLCDYQSNIAFSLAKEKKESPIKIAEEIKEELSKDKDTFSEVSVAGNGFINLKLSDKFLSETTNNLLHNKESRINKNKKSKTIIVDYGGYNIGKQLHMGHLRPTIIGESIVRICKIKGDKTIGDVHLGDWGKPMGLIIEEIRDRGLDKTGVKLEDLNEIYPTASNKAKENEDFNKRALKATDDLQNGEEEATKIWKQFTSLSIEHTKKIIEVLDARFDLWEGEASADKITRETIEKLKKSGEIILDNGAYIIELPPEYTDGKKLPPIIMEKTSGGLMYASTDIGTIVDRMNKFNPDEILYVVDDRQSLHFEQVFAAVRKTKLVKPETHLEHLKFGTICGEDGKPLKSRDGTAITLNEAINEAISKGIEKLKDRNISEKDKKEIGTIIGVSSLKFADLMNDRTQNYIFNMEKAVASEGKTGAYILYSIVRINSILQKNNIKEENLEKKEIQIPESKYERDLQLSLVKLPDIIDRAYDLKKPHIICEYLFEIAQKFNSFYANETISGSKEPISLLTKQIMELLCYLLGMKTVKEM